MKRELSTGTSSSGEDRASWSDPPSWVTCLFILFFLPSDVRPLEHGHPPSRYVRRGNPPRFLPTEELYDDAARLLAERSMAIFCGILHYTALYHLTILGNLLRGRGSRGRSRSRSRSRSCRGSDSGSGKQLGGGLVRIGLAACGRRGAGSNKGPACLLPAPGSCCKVRSTPGLAVGSCRAPPAHAASVMSSAGDFIKLRSTRFLPCSPANIRPAIRHQRRASRDGSSRPSI